MDFSQPYNQDTFLKFLKDNFLPNDFVISKEKINLTDLSFKPERIQKIELLGEVLSLDLKIYEIYHESENDPRVTLSRETFRIMANYSTKKALILFYSKNSPNYRFSLTTIDLKLEDTRVTKEYSNPRRYSFFLGPDARVHTPCDFLIKKGRVSDTKDLLSRFDVEIVTKEFFSKYKGLYENVRDYFDKDNAFRIFASKNNIDIDTFSKKLLGQIVFCYFLQRKGWLGAKRGEPINKGDKDFLRTIFNRNILEKKNFYNDYLEYLFYGSLNNRSESSSDFYRKHFDSQIPFLNGGLFEPIENYNWEKSFVHIPDKIFSNKENTGILDVFDLYNFTVYEDDPIDREVSVDPEMLGKVFENLLSDNLRKGRGAYYTPREIVHYMCQESLINYLSTETKINLNEIREFIIDKEVKFSVDGSELLEKTLSKIKVCDPACGSGAFLVGMLHEIVSARRILNPNHDEYHLKKETIQNCIYGVDIDLGAVEIAKLRLWLSLVVDYELKDIEPLPNLDYKIMCGNSLLEELIIGEESIELFDEKLFKKEKKSLSADEKSENKNISGKDEYLKNVLEEKQKEIIILSQKNQLTREKKKELENEIDSINKELNPKNKKIKDIDIHPSLFIEEAEKYFKILKELHKKYFSEYDSLQKKKIRNQIENIELEFIKSTVKEKVNEIGTKIQNLNMRNPDDRKKQVGLLKKKLEYIDIPERIRNTKVRPYFLWHLNFFEVFQEKNGFDIVIANPPYINTNEMKGNADLYRNLYSTAYGSYDIYVLFFEKSIQLLHEHAILTFITSNKFFIADYAKKLRSLLLNKINVLKLLDLADCRQVFENVLVSPAITIIKKQKVTDNYVEVSLLKDEDIYKIDSICFRKIKTNELSRGEGSAFDIYLDKDNQPIINKVYSQSVLLDNIADVRTGIMGFEYWNMKSYISEGQSVKESIRVITNSHLDRYIFLFNKKINLYKKNFNNPFLDVANAPINDNTKELFKKKKIIVRGVAKELTANIDENGYALLVAVHSIFLKDTDKFNDFYILALLNSKLFNWLHLIKFYTARIPKGSLKYPVSFFKGLPIKELQKVKQQSFIELVDKILAIKQKNLEADTSSLEHQIDQMVYKLYNLTEAEIKIVEKK